VVLAKNSQCVRSAEGAPLFFGDVDAWARPHGWTRKEPFRADGRRMESWASLKRLVHKDGSKAQKVQAVREEDPGHPTLDFRGQKRSHATHRSRTDPDCGLYRKAQGQEARLGLGGLVRKDTRHGLGGEFRIQDPMAEPEPEVALQPGAVVGALHSGVRVKTVGADKAYPRRDFVAG
jgi:hypothetical protein